MAETQVEQSLALAPTCMESVNRITKLPVIESTIQTASNIYEKVKDYNGVTQWTCSTAENAVHMAVEVSKPIVQGLEGPIKKVDGVLCSGLDYVEDKIPAVKLPAGEMYNSTKDYVNKTVTPRVESAYHYVEPTVKSAYEKIEPAVEIAKTVVEPAVEKAIHMVEPFVQPAIEKAQALRDYGAHKLEEIVHCHNHPERDMECDDCKRAASEKENQDQYVGNL